MFVLLLFDCTHIWLQKASIYEIKYLPRTQWWLRILIREVMSFLDVCLRWCGFMEAVNICNLLMFLSLLEQIYKQTRLGYQAYRKLQPTSFAFSMVLACFESCLSFLLLYRMNCVTVRIVHLSAPCWDTKVLPAAGTLFLSTLTFDLWMK